MTNIITTTDVPFTDLMDRLKTRGVDSQAHLAKILKRDPADISRFFTASASSTVVISICAGISKVFNFVVVDYPAEKL
jgi:hypothetical protein